MSLVSNASQLLQKLSCVGSRVSRGVYVRSLVYLVSTLAGVCVMIDLGVHITMLGTRVVPCLFLVSYVTLLSFYVAPAVACALRMNIESFNRCAPYLFGSGVLFMLRDSVVIVLLLCA